MSNIPQIFDRKALVVRRARAAVHFREYGFLIEETAERLIARLEDFKRRFSSILVIGTQGGIIAEKLMALGYLKNEIVTIDLATEMQPDIVADEEYLPFLPESFDCVISHLCLPFVNDVPGVLAQIGRALKPDGLFLATTLGTNTLRDFQATLMKAEIALFDGASSRVGPFVDIVDAAALMQRTGFALPVVDQDKITVDYRNVTRLMHDLRGMGWSSPQARRGAVRLSKSFFNKIDKTYKKQKIIAEFEILYLTGWRASANQQRPLSPGSAKHRLADFLDAEERGL